MDSDGADLGPVKDKIENLASRRVAEKTGLTLEKEVDMWNTKVCVFAIVGA